VERLDCTGYGGKVYSFIKAPPILMLVQILLYFVQLTSQRSIDKLLKTLPIGFNVFEPLLANQGITIPEF